MEEQSPRQHNKLEDEEEEFRSCCGDGDEIKEEEEPKEDLDEFSVKIYFKGFSITEAGESGTGYSGIGVVMERKEDVSLVRVQKKLDFYVDSSVADYLALMEGLIEAVKNDISRVYAYTDCSLLYNQITHEEKLGIPLLVALRERIIELTGDLEMFSLKLVPCCDLERPLCLALIAIGIVTLPTSGDESHENCSICCEDKLMSMMITMKCSHKFCSHCMRTYVEDKVQSYEVPIRCPQLGCKYYVSVSEGQSFLTHASYESFAKAQAEADDAFLSSRIYCPYTNCSVILGPRECLSSSQPYNNCAECPLCQRFLCVECQVPWHSSMSCDEYQNLPLEERDDATDDSITRSVQESEQWAWDTFNTMHMLTDAYSDQERSQLALIQRFLSGGFSLSDHHHPPQSPPPCTDSSVDIMKDLQPFPWLERFMSVITDDYNEYPSFSER
ncbi:E3 ubiquitin-protein ligase RSL1 [Linum perenne]